mmetsp:Transcript_73548/g.117246  ORF Transcript_73548/g.117246 Transcript_73548/m.117246 type:complete len:242 (+) Transcript_73548:1052-1777(+)
MAGFRLNVKQLSGDQFFVDVQGSDTVFALKQQIEEITNIESNKQRLIFSARELIDSKALKEYANLVEGKTIHLVIRRNIDIEAGHGEPETLRQPLREAINHTNEAQELDEEGLAMIDVMELSRSCRLIKIFALIDCALMIVFAIYNTYFLIGVPLAICGFIGAKRLQRVPLAIYAVFILLSIAFRVFLAYYYFSWLMIALSVISILLEMYILKQTLSVFKKIPNLSLHDVRMLQELSNGFI